MRGGYRPNSGPKKGAHYRPRTPKPGQPSATMPAKKPRKAKPPPEPTDADKIRQMLAMGTKVRARMYQEFLRRVGKGEKLTLAEKKMMEKIGEELQADVNGEKPPVTVDGKIETPLEHLLRVMNDPKESEETRLRAASLAAPFCHVRKGEGAGKKEEKQGRAESAGKGRFRASAPPQLKVVSNEK
mgnify:CR=1 FL=1